MCLKGIYTFPTVESKKPSCPMNQNREVSKQGENHSTMEPTQRHKHTGRALENTCPCHGQVSGGRVIRWDYSCLNSHHHRHQFCPSRCHSHPHHRPSHCGDHPVVVQPESLDKVIRSQRNQDLVYVWINKNTIFEQRLTWSFWRRSWITILSYGKPYGND